jgi:hypothetical protein
MGVLTAETMNTSFADSISLADNRHSNDSGRKGEEHILHVYQTGISNFEIDIRLKQRVPAKNRLLPDVC